MLRVIFLLLFTALPAMGAEGMDLDTILSKLEKKNPFAPPVVSQDQTGLGNLYSTLNNIATAAYGPGGSGCVVLNGSPWRTGEERFIQDGAKRSRVELVAVRAGEEGQPPAATFRIVGTDQEIAVVLPSLPEPPEIRPDNAGWLVTPELVVTSDKLYGSVRAKVGRVEVMGQTVAQAPDDALVMISLSAQFAGSWRAADPAYSGPVRVVPLHGEPLLVPNAVIRTPPTKEFLIGALLTTPAGEFVGILGKRGAVLPAAFAVKSTTEGNAFALPFERRVILCRENASAAK